MDEQIAQRAKSLDRILVPYWFQTHSTDKLNSKVDRSARLHFDPPLVIRVLRNGGPLLVAVLGSLVISILDTCQFVYIGCRSVMLGD